jgi:hypothetical protein
MTQSILALNATTGTTTSANYPVAGAKRIGFLFTRTNHSAGSSTFTVNIGLQDVSEPSPTMVACNVLVDNVTNTNAQNLTRIGSRALASNTSSVVWLDFPVTFVNVSAVTATDGNSTAYILAEYND